MEGDDTDGHIDALARLLIEHTILYNYTEDKGDVHYEVAEVKSRIDFKRRWKSQFRTWCHFLSLVLSIIRRGSIARYVR